MRLLDLDARVGAPEVAHDFGIGVQLDFELEVFVGEWHEREPLAVEDRLFHVGELSGWRKPDPKHRQPTR